MTSVSSFAFLSQDILVGKWYVCTSLLKTLWLGDKIKSGTHCIQLGVPEMISISRFAFLSQLFLMHIIE